MKDMTHLFIHDVENWRKTKVRNPAGGWKEDWAKHSDVKGRMSTFTPGDVEKVENAQQQFQFTHVLYCAATEDIVEDDRIKFRGKTYEVKQVRNPSFVDHHFECYLRQLKVGEA